MSSGRANNNEETVAKRGCAACLYQRRKCHRETCMLYPYLPAERRQDFSAVHKYFGASKISKHIKKLAVEERERSVESFVWAARAWNQNPNTGPLGLYLGLAQENERLKQEIQELKTATNHGKTENLGIDSSINGNYSSLVTNFDPMPLNYHQWNDGLYYDGQGVLNPNFGNMQQRVNLQNGMDYERAGNGNQMEINSQNTDSGRDVVYPPFDVTDDLWR